MNKPSAIVTGAASGIGKQAAKTLIEKGFSIIAADIQIDELKRAFEPSEQLHLVELDVRSVDHWKKAIELANKSFGRLDYLLNIAGISIPGFITETPIENVALHVDINVKGVIYGTKLAAEIMVKQGAGHIINIASLAGIAPVPGLSIYSASKHAVRAFSLAASYELEPKGVLVTVLCPDVVDTPMTDNTFNYQDEVALAFSGSSKLLQAEDVVQAIFKAMQNKRREILLPASRGWLSKIGNLFPGLGGVLLPRLQKKDQSK